MVKLLYLIKRWFARIDASGATAVEFAVVGGAFILLLMASLEFGYMLVVQAVLDNAARDASRLILTGQAQGSSDAQTTFQSLLCNNTGALIGCGNVIYAAQAFNDWTSAQAAVNTPLRRDASGNFQSSGFNPGLSGQIVVVTVTYNYKFFTAWIGGLVGNGTNSAFLMSRAVFQNEAF